MYVYTSTHFLKLGTIFKKENMILIYSTRTFINHVSNTYMPCRYNNLLLLEVVVTVPFFIAVKHSSLTCYLRHLWMLPVLKAALLKVFKIRGDA